MAVKQQFNHPTTTRSVVQDDVAPELRHELLVIEEVVSALSTLPADSMERVMRYLGDRYGFIAEF